MPSPSAVFTSAPSLSSARTASRLPCIAASATDAGAAAYISAEQASPIPPIAIRIRRIALPFRICGLDDGHGGVQVERAGAVAEFLQVGPAERVQHRQHRI